MINDLSIGEKEKTELLTKLSEEGLTEDLIVDIQIAIAETQAKLNKQYKPIVSKLQQLVKEEDQALDTAHQKFEEQMDQLEENAGVFYKAVSEQVDKQKIEDARKQLKVKA